MDLLSLIGLVFVIYSLIIYIFPWFLDCNLQLAVLEQFGKRISSLKGQVVWITGASSGIGEHLAYVLAKAGCKLILSARREEELQRVKESCLKAGDGLKDDDILVLPLDICDIDLHQETFDKIIKKFGKLDILVNNAGRSQRAQWENIELNVDREMFELNVFSQLSLSRIVMKYFLQNNCGHIVITSSIAGIIPVPNSATYTATKFALYGYYESFLVEKLDKDIWITLVCPGPIQTNFLAEAFTEKSGKKLGMKTDIDPNKMSAERCAILMGIAIANKVSEAWIAQSTVLFITYLIKYHPYLNLRTVLRFLGAKFIQRIRDAKNADKL